MAEEGSRRSDVLREPSEVDPGRLSRIYRDPLLRLDYPAAIRLMTRRGVRSGLRKGGQVRCGYSEIFALVWGRYRLSGIARRRRCQRGESRKERRGVGDMGDPVFSSSRGIHADMSWRWKPSEKREVKAAPVVLY